MTTLTAPLVAATTPRLTLRAWNDADIAPFKAALNVPAVTQWLGGVQDDAAFQAIFERITASQERDGFCFWIVERRNDAAILGFCGLKRVDTPGVAFAGDIEIGWRLREDAWGQGYAREAAEAALGWAFVNTDAPHIVAMTVPQNHPSWGLMMRLGMTRARHLDFDHPLVDDPIKHHIVYSIDREDWTQ